MSEPKWYAPRGAVTAALPGVGGLFKASPDDFEVDELPAYEPCGQGDHLFLWVEKRGLSSEALLSTLSRALGVRRTDIGCAGLKDTQALTRQYVSVPAAAEARLARLQEDSPEPRLRILRSALHRNKLRTGHLRGNRFRIRLRGCVPDALPRARAIAVQLQAQGLPNFYGLQRFGRDANTLSLGLALLRGEASKGEAKQGFARRLALSSVQSGLYNAYLAARLADGLLHRVLEGDVLQVCASKGPFVTDDVAREQARFEAREVVPAGPMFGPKMRPTTGEAAAREAAVLAAHGLTLAHFVPFGKLTLGTRRANLVWLDDLEVAGASDGLDLAFSLPPGSYATGVLAELVKDAL